MGYRQFWANHYFRATVEIVWVLGIDERRTLLAAARHTLVDPPRGIARKLAWQAIKSAAGDRMEELLSRAREGSSVGP